MSVNREHGGTPEEAISKGKYETNIPFLELGHHHDWSKGFFFGNEHVVLHISEHCGLHEEA